MPPDSPLTTAPRPDAAPPPVAAPRVGVLGLGYVGLPLAVDFARAGLDVVGFDVDAGLVGDLTAGRSRVEDVAPDVLQEALDRLRPTTSEDALRGADAVVICVPTPLTAHREPDLGPLQAAAATVARVLEPGMLVVLESTSFPGTTREVLQPVLEAGGLRAGTDFALAYSPERVDPGRPDPRRATPKVVGGTTASCTAAAVALYERVCDEIVPVSSCEAAELTKLLENVFRSVNIALVNELAMLADRMGIDIWEVVDAASTKPYGFMRFEPGPGLGGHCLPIDPFYLAWKAREHDFATEFIELAGKTNQAMPYYCLSRAERALNDRSLPVRGARVLLVGMSYKGGVGDLRESPALKLAALLTDRGAEVSYHDPHVPALDDGRRSVPDAGAAAAASDLVVIVTAHPEVDHRAIARAASAVLDLRNAVGEPMAHVERL